jgi:TonB family protein
MARRHTGRRWGSPLLTGPAVLALVWSVVVTPAAQAVDQRLRESAAAGDIEATRTLLARGDQIAINSTDPLGWTALMYAADAGHDAVVQLLLDAGGDVNRKNAAQDTLLHLAVARGRTRVVQLLLEAGADFGARDANGRTPLFLAIDGGFAEIIELLHAAARDSIRPGSPALALTVKDETSPPVIIQWTDPPYAEESLAQQIEGTVVLMAIVRQDGSVGAVSVSKSLEERLDQNAVRAVKTWRFDPATRAGTSVVVVVAISVDFRLPEKP